jgi:polysaccharide chain length determinant protein (PEP-CTERM system associated)
MTTEYELTVSDYLSILRRRALVLVVIFAVVLLIAIVLAFKLPPTYRASGTIMVETPQLLEGVVAPKQNKNDLDERINLVKQRVMTREGLLQVISKHNLFKESSGKRSPNDLIEMLRSRIVVETISSNQPSVPASTFTVSFDDQRPEVALQVTNDLVTLFLDWNVKLRTEDATETATFLSQESNKLKAEVDRLEEKIGAFKRQNSENLPEQLTLRATIMSRAENDLYAVERDIRSGNEELRSLEAELSAARHGMSDDPSQSLPALKAEYTKLSAMYTESHPDIRALKRKIDAIEQGANIPDPKNTIGSVTNLAVFKIQAKVDAVNARLESLSQQKKMLQSKLAQNEHAMELTPRVAQGLDVLIRDRDSAQRKFDELRNRKMNAQIAQNLESENKSERFVLLEPPILPERPFKPNRIQILAIGLMAALGSAVGVAMALEMLDKRIRGVEAFTHVLGQRPLVVIPFLYTEEETRRKSLNIRSSIVEWWQRRKS